MHGRSSPFEFGNLFLQSIPDRLGQLLAVGDQDGGSVLVMLGLTEQVSGHDSGIALPVGDNQDLAGSGHHVDAYPAEDLLLRLSHKLVAGSHDLVHSGDGFCSVCQCSDRLGAAYPEDPVHAADLRRRKNIGVDLPVLAGGRHHADLLHPGDLGRDGVHQDAGGIRCRASGDVKPHPLQRQHLLAHHDSVLVVEKEAVADLVLMESHDAVRRPEKNLDQNRVGPAETLLHSSHAHFHRGDVRAVELLRISLESLVAVGPHVLQNSPDGFFHTGYRILPGEDGFPFGLGFLQNTNHVSSSSAMAST